MPRTPIDKPAKFVWPPGLPSDAPPAPPVREVVPADASWLRTFEEDFLGRTVAPFAIRAADEHWLPDTRADYCPRCGSSASDHEPGFGAADDSAACSWCEGKRLLWSNFVRLGRYEGLLRDAILELKFSAWRAIGLEVGRLLGQQLALELSRARIPPERVLLVPVPTTWRRRLMRGVDHTLILARGMAQHVPVQIGRPIGRRHAPSQVSLAASVREQNVAGVFYERSYRIPNIQLVVVLDDVRTTGATLRASCRSVRRWLRRRAGGARHTVPSVWACAAGVTPDDPRRPAS